VTDLDQTILRKIADGPVRLRSLQGAKARVSQLVDAGLAERVAPPNGRGRNMVQITAKGREMII